MGTRQRRRENDERMGGGPGGGPGGEGLEATRSRAERLLRAGDDAIQRALSGDSEEFLRSSRQQSGE